MSGGPTARTRVYAVLGHPVDHSLSPTMQNAAFRASGQDAAYVALDVPPERLGDALRGLHAAGVAGLNLTTPLKEAAWPYLAGASEEAARMRTVNTLRWERGGWMGHATDGEGFGDWIGALRVPVRGARVLLLGAGGAARSIAPWLLSMEPAAIQVLSRDGGHARALAEDVGSARAKGTRGVAVRPGSFDDSPAIDPAGAFDLLIRALASDAIGAEEARWWDTLRPDAPALELNYGARAAASRSRAKRDGRPFEDGIGLLLHQGARSFEFWTGTAAPIGVMRAALRTASEALAQATRVEDRP